MSEQSGQPPQPEQPQKSFLPTETNENTDFKSIGLGCIYGLIIFLVLFIGLWIYVFTSIYKNLAINNPSIYGVFVVLSALISFSAGTYVFLRWAVPKINIRNFGRLPNITINRKKARGGLKNLTIIRILVSVITCILVYLVVILVWVIIGAIITPNPWSIFSSIITIAIPVIGLIFSPIIAIMIYSRTSAS
jgi:hypothetical protein